MARFSTENRNLLVMLYVVLAALCAGVAIATLDVDLDQGPRITLDKTTAALQAELDRQFPGVEQTFLAIVESRDPETAREQAQALSASLKARSDLFLSAFVPGTGDFYDVNALLFREAPDVRSRVDALLQMQPLYQAIAAAPDIPGFAALINEIGNAVEQGRSPPGFESLLLAASSAIEGEVRGRPRPIQWNALAGLGGEARSMRWYVLATPQPGVERQAASFARQSADGMQGVAWLWPKRALSSSPSPLRDFVVPGGLSIFITFTLLGAGLGSFRQTLAIMLTGAVTLSASAAAAAAMGRALDSATWSFAVAVLAPVLVSGTVICVSYAGGRAKGVSAAQAVMLAAHRKGGLVSAITILFAAVWVSWLVRQLPSINQFAMIALIGTALAWLTALTLLPACLALFSRKPESSQTHWMDDALGDAATYHARNATDVVAMIVLAAAVFSAAFLPGMRFGERQTPSTPAALLETPDARGAVHIVVPQGEVAGLVERLARLPEVGAIRTAEQFLPPDAARKVAELHRLEAMSPFEPAPRGPVEEDALPQTFIELERQLTAIASGPATSPELRDAVLRLRRAVNLFTNPQPPTLGRVDALEQSLFGNLGALSVTAQRLAALRQPGIGDLDPDLLRRFVSAEGNWRVEVMPRTGTGTLSFAASLRRAATAAAGEPVLALVRNEIIHHETLLALAAALVAAAILVLASLRSLTAWVLAMAPVCAFVTLTAAIAAAFDLAFNAAMLAGASTAAAVLIASSMIVAQQFGTGSTAERQGGASALRCGLLPPLTLAGAVAPLALSSRPALQEFGAVMALVLLMASLLCVLLVPALARWISALTERRRA